MNKLAKVINRIMFYGFFVMGVILLFYGTGRISSMVMAFESFIAAVIAVWILKVKNINEKYLIYINILLWLNLLGEIVFYYSGALIYDKVLHILSGILLSAVLYDYYKKNSDFNKDMIFIAVLGLLGLWEIAEFSVDSFLGFQSQGVVRGGIFIQSPFLDTMYDLIWGAIGSLCYLFFKEEKMDITIRRDVNKVREFAKNKVANAPNYFRNSIREMFGF
jgi:hypothetical protein